jgi:hypothetical protein
VLHGRLFLLCGLRRGYQPRRSHLGYLRSLWVRATRIARSATHDSNIRRTF